MKRGLNYISLFFDKIGKRNVILILFVVCVILISCFYATFSLSTTSGGVTFIDGVKTLHFVLGDASDEDVYVPAGSTKNIAITVSNHESYDLSYGIYYSSLSNLDGVTIGYHHSSKHLPKGIIRGNSDYIVTVSVSNQTEDVVPLTFGIVYGLPNGGDLVLGDRQYFLSKMMKFPLNEVKKGSYVQYVGNNGCVEGQCNGLVGQDNFNYCGNEEFVYSSSGYRVAYIKNGYAYLISSGAVACVKHLESDEDDFITKLNKEALKYCNINYSYRGACDDKSVWSMGEDDFKYIVGNGVHFNSCIGVTDSSLCGLSNDLLNNNGYYWLTSGIRLFHYFPNAKNFQESNSDMEMGVRPIIKMSDSVVVSMGSGTYDDPYIIENTNLPDYQYTVVYNGNGATSGNISDSVFYTNVTSKLAKNEFELEYKINMDEFASFDDSYCDDNGVCFPSSVDLSGMRKATFLGWSTSIDSNEVVYQDEEEVVNLSHSSDEVIVDLYAVWSYDVLFLPDIQSREGYQAIGWYTSDNQKVGDPGDKYTNTEKVTLYAKWEKNNE